MYLIVMLKTVISTVNSQEEVRAKARELEEKVYNYFSVGQFDSFVKELWQILFRF